MIGTQKKEIKPIKLSIITAVFNRKEMVEDAIISVLEQWHEEIEHIIIDGGSTDGTLEVLAKFPHLTVISEPDDGIYDAWNKGVQIAKGKHITFLNSDDKWRPETIGLIMNRLSPLTQILAMNSLVFRLEDNGEYSYENRIQSREGKILLSELTSKPLSINSWIISKHLINYLGGFKSIYPIAGDVDFCIRAILNGVKIEVYNLDFYAYTLHSASVTLNNDLQAKYNYQYENLCVGEEIIHAKIGSRVECKKVKSWMRNTTLKLLSNSIYLRKGVKNFLILFYRGCRINIFFPLFFLIRSGQYLSRKY